MYHTPVHKIPAPTDVYVRNHGTLFGFTPSTDGGKEWLATNLSHAATLGDSYYVEHRYAWDIAQGMVDDGLKVS